MPRLAPVSSMTRRGVLEAAKRVSVRKGSGTYWLAPAASMSGIEPRLVPAVAAACEHHPIVEAKRAVAQDLHGDGGDAIAPPIGGARHLADRVLRGVERDCLLEREAALERARLLACPSTDAAVTRTARKIRIRLGLAYLGNRAARPHLPTQALPMEDQRRLGVRRKLSALGRFGVGVEDETALVRALEEHHAHIRQPVGICGRERHGSRAVRLRPLGLGRPGAEDRPGLAGLGEVTLR